MRRLVAGGLVLLAAACGAPADGSGARVEPSSTVVVRPVLLDPVVPGWSPVRSVKRAAAYDVPPSWHVRTEGTIVGYEGDDGQRVGASGAADYGAGACGENSSLAVAGVKHDTGSDLARAAEATAREWAGLAYRDGRKRAPRLSVDSPEQTTVFGGRAAVLVKVAAKVAAPTGSCKLSRGTVYAVAATGFTGELGPTAVLVVVADVGVPDAVPEAEIRQVLGTLRPV